MVLTLGAWTGGGKQALKLRLPILACMHVTAPAALTLRTKAFLTHFIFLNWYYFSFNPDSHCCIPAPSKASPCCSEHGTG